jgi:hypothetical protein
MHLRSIVVVVCLSVDHLGTAVVEDAAVLVDSDLARNLAVQLTSALAWTNILGHRRAQTSMVCRPGT